MRQTVYLLTLCAFGLASAAKAQLPADAIMLDKVKIAEKVKSTDLDPVTLQPSDANGPTWNYEGVDYRGSKPDSKDKFMADPKKFAEQAKFERYVQNYVKSMSVIWCPVTDQVNPGGLHEWNVKGVKYEACCEFCETSYRDEDFDSGLERLKARAKTSYGLTGGKYTEGAKSPVDGAVKQPTNVAAAAGAPKGQPAGEGTAPAEPEYMKGKTLKPTYAEGIALVFENRCLGCHHKGGMAPMSFETLGETKKWTKSMKNSVVNRAMPPWPADPAVGAFANSRLITDKEIDLISKWCDAGFPPGDGEYKSDKKFGEWTIGEPDQIFQLPAYTVGENVTDEVKDFEVATSFPEDRWIVASQVIPGNDIDVFSINAGPLGVYATGNHRDTYSNGTGELLKAGEKVKVKVHYSKEKGYASSDTGAKIGVKFAKDKAAMKFDVKVDPMANADFSLPAGADNVEVKSQFKFAGDGQIVSLMPMMKLRGKSIAVKAIFPDGKEKPLLSIPHWDPEWKVRYELAKPLAAPKGTVVEMTAKFDNSVTNVKNPDPKMMVKGGAEEVAEGWIGYSLN